MRRLWAVLLSLVAVLGLAVAAPQPAAADGPVGTGVEFACDGAATASPIGVIGNIITGGGVYDMCEKIGDTAQEKVKEAWDEVWESVLGDVINSAADVTKWTIKKVLTVSLMGPSVDLEGTGLFGKDATLAGMLTWLGLVIATAGAMWQIGKMAITGQSRHIGRALLGWVENTVLSAVGVALIALLLVAGDALTTGLVDAAFKDDGKAYETIVTVMVPAAVKNPVTMLCVVTVLLLIGFVQLILVFLRQSAIPIQCLLLPVAAGGRVGGDATRQWAPRLITSILVVIAYKPILALIICVGFSEFGHANTLAEWLRGCATFLLAILAPGPLTRLFAPFGEAVGGGMASGGFGGALSAAGGYFKGKQDGGDSGGAAPMTPLEYARYVEQSMGSRNGPDDPPDNTDGPDRSGPNGPDGTPGRDAQLHAARNETSRVPGQATTGEGAPSAPGVPGGASTKAGTASTTGGAAVAGGVGLAIEVLDGVNDTLQDASGQIGNGGNSQ
ncbi:hypothetical protein [Streptomyces ambofaciens]|nr:hypothetical protein [Streptomyces ambofaciens]